jgi:hypothetical protein
LVVVVGIIVVEVVVVVLLSIQSQTVWQSTVLFTIVVNWLYKLILFVILFITIWTISTLHRNSPMVETAVVKLSQVCTPVQLKFGPE